MHKGFLLIMTAAASSLFCEAERSNEQIRISPKEVHVSDQGIFIFLNEQWVPVELFKDSKKARFSIQPLYQQRSWGLFWECECGAVNSSLPKLVRTVA